MSLTKRELATLAQGRKLLRKHGELSPLLLVDGEKSGTVTFSEFGPGGKGRAILRQAGRACRQYHPWRVWFLSDTWMAEELLAAGQDPDEYIANYKPGDLSRNPLAGEALVLVVQTRDLATRVIIQKYEVEGDKYTFEPPRLWPQPGPNPIVEAFWEGMQ